MSEQEEIKLFDKISTGLKRTYEELLRRKAALGLDMVVGDSQGHSVEVPATELLAMYEETQERNR